MIRRNVRSDTGPTRGAHHDRGAAHKLAKKKKKRAYLGRLDPHADEQLGVGERQLDNLSQLPDLLAQAPDLAEADPSGVLVEHVEHRGVHLCAPRHQAKPRQDKTTKDAERPKTSMLD